MKGVLVVDRSGQVLCARIAGLRGAASIDSVDELIPGLDRSGFAEALEEAIVSGEARTFLVAGDADRDTLSLYIAPAPDASAVILIELPDTPGTRTGISRSAREARALCEVALQVNQSLDPNRVFDLVARHAAILLGAEAARVVLLDGDMIVVRAAHGGIRAGVGTRVPAATTLSGEAIRTRRPVRTRDLHAEAARWPSAISVTEGVRANGIGVPLALADEPFGAIVVFGNATRDFDAQDEIFLLALASHAVNAIENARLFASQHHEREQAQAAAIIARAALESSSAADAGYRILTELERLLDVSGMGLAVIEDSGATLHYIAAVGNAAGLAGVRVAIEESVSRGRFDRERPLRIESFRGMTHHSYRHRVPECPGIIVPLYAKGRLIGTIGAADDEVRPLSPESIAALARLAPTIALAIDVLQLGEAERSRRLRERLLASALAMLAEPVLILDPSCRVLYANAAAEGEYGFSAAEFEQRTIWDLHADRDRPLPPATIDEILGESGTWSGQTMHRRKDGSCFPAATSQTLIRDDNGTVVGRVVRACDLTGTLHAEEERRQTEKMAALGALVAGVAHELNNPLTGISAFAQLLLEEPMSEEQADSVRLMKREADRAAGVIRDLLVFSRKSGEQRSPVNINTTIDLTFRLRAHGFRAAGIDVVMDLDPTVPMILGDEAKLQQVLLNLFVNAEQAMVHSPVRRLTTRTRAEHASVRIEVADTGAGMSPDVQAHIFEPFYTTKPAGAGTGLGLSVSYGIVQSHGGSCAVESAPGVGTTFRITLPVTPPTIGPDA